MKQYLDAVQQVLSKGTRKENRTGIDTLSTLGVHYNIDLREGFPLLTTKAISWKNIVIENLWFLSGKTDIGLLKKHKCKFWDAWADQEGRVPSAYGNFWRRFPIHGVIPVSSGKDHLVLDQGYNDQIKWVIEECKRNPMSRRMVVSAWAPGNAQASKLPPCHCMWALNVQNMVPLERRKEYEADELGHYDLEKRLCLHLTQRSCDIALGVPYNIAGYAFILELMSRFVGIPAGDFSHTLIDAHAYTCKPDGSMAEYDHVPGLREQLLREPRPLPKLQISDSIRNIEDIEALLECSTDEIMEHFQLVGYDPHPAIVFKVAV